MLVSRLFLHFLRNKRKTTYQNRHGKKIEAKQRAINAGQWNTAKQLTRDIRKLARSDKEKKLITELELMTQEGYQWDGLKRVRKPFQPKRYKFKNKHGDPINEKEFSETAADYFADVQWAAPQDNYLDPDKENSPLIDGNSSMDDSPFTPHEFDAVLKVLKNNKAPGPDGCRSELIKWLSGINRLYLLELFNDIHINGIYPECFTLANIAALYKKGDATQMKNYRPIALLQVFYKILARLARNRFQCAYDSWIQNSQFGFSTQEINITSHFCSQTALGHSRTTTVEYDAGSFRLGESF